MGIETRRKIAASISILLGALSLESCSAIDKESPDEAIERVSHNHDIANVLPEDCFEFTMTSGGVGENLIRAIKKNPAIKSIDSLDGGVHDTTADISDTLNAIDDLAGHNKDSIQIGDVAEYCIDDNVVVVGDPLHFRTIG